MEYYGQTVLRDSEPVRQRYQERQEALAHRELLAPLVHKWMDEDPSPAAMVQRLREAHLLTPQQRSIVELLMLELLSSASGDALELDGR
jgi:hypothetical protein